MSVEDCEGDVLRVAELADILRFCKGQKRCLWHLQSTELSSRFSLALGISSLHFH